MTLNAELVENFHAIFRQRQSGSLIVTGKDTVRFLFQDGEVMAMDLGQDKELLLVDKLREYHRLDQTQHALVLATRERVQGAVSDIVSQLQLASDEEIGQTTRAMVEDNLCGVFGGAVTKLRFDPGQQVASYNFDRTAVRLRIAVEVLLKTVETRVNEIEEVSKAVGSNESTYAFAEGAENAGALSDFEKHVLNFVDGHSTIDDMARACRDSSANLSRILYALTKKGVIRRLAPRKGTGSGANPVIAGPPSGQHPTVPGGGQSSGGYVPRPAEPTVQNIAPMPPAAEPPSLTWLWVSIAVAVLVAIGLFWLISKRSAQDADFEKHHTEIIDQIKQRDWNGIESTLSDMVGQNPDDVEYQRKVKAISDEVDKAVVIEDDGIRKAIDAGNFGDAHRRLARLPDSDATTTLKNYIASKEDDYKTQVATLVAQVDQDLGMDSADGLTKALALIQSSGLMGKEPAVQVLVAHWANKHLSDAQTHSDSLADRAANLDLVRRVMTGPDDQAKIDQTANSIDADTKAAKATIAQLNAFIDQGDSKSASALYSSANISSVTEGTTDLQAQVDAIHKAIIKLDGAKDAYLHKVLDAIGQGSPDDIEAEIKDGDAMVAGHTAQPDTQALIDALHDLQDILHQPPVTQSGKIDDELTKGLSPELTAAFNTRKQWLQQQQDEIEILLARLNDRLTVDPVGNEAGVEKDLGDIIQDPRYTGTAGHDKAVAMRDNIIAARNKREADEVLLEAAMEKGEPGEVDRLCKELGLKYPPLWIGSSPMGAEIDQNGIKIGVTPKSFPVTAADRDAYAIELKMPGFVTKDLTAKGAVGGWRVLVPMERSPVCPPVNLGQIVTSRPTALGNEVWVANSAQAFLIALNGTVAPVAFEAGGTAPLSEPIYAPMVASDDGIYQATRQNLAIHIDTKTHVISRVPLGGSSDFAPIIYTSPDLLDRRFAVIAGNDGAAHGIDILHSDFRWSGPAGQPFAGAPALVGGSVLFVHKDGILESLEVNDGKVLGTAAIGAPVVTAWPMTDAKGAITGLAGYTANAYWTWTGTGDITSMPLPQTAVAGSAGAFIGSNGTDNEVVWQLSGSQWLQVGRAGGKHDQDPLVWNGEIVVVTRSDDANPTGTATFIDTTKDATHPDRGFSVTQPSEFLQPVVVGGDLVLVTEGGVVLIYSP